MLSELRSATSLQLKVSKDGVVANVFVRTPGLVRWEESARRYRISAGSRLWKVDEEANTVEESDSPWFLSPQERIDLLSLLDSGITDASRLLTAQPMEQTIRDGRECLIYRTTLPTKNSQIDIEAAADSKNLQLLEIAAWKPENRRKGPPLAEMTLVALNVAVADEQFDVSKSLSEGGRIGSIKDAQGLVVLRPRLAKRWTPIRREKRDPGLLEWTSGNIFKARVFPIEANSEKRMKIVYTQVLPLRSNKYRYSYGLRSELLRTKPLRELSLSVTVNSALALKKVTCPTHAARITKSEKQTRRADTQPLAFHSAQVEFSAQEYSPSRDFEVVFEIDGKQNDVVVIPHQRGGDGYFPVQLTPPGSDGNWQREVLPDGAPLKLVLLCDTSMSMDEAKRSDHGD